MISDGASWIRNVCEELFSGRAVNCIPDFFRVSEYLSDALKAILPDGAERRQRFKADKARLSDAEDLCRKQPLGRLPALEFSSIKTGLTTVYGIRPRHEGRLSR